MASSEKSDHSTAQGNAKMKGRSPNSTTLALVAGAVLWISLPLAIFGLLTERSGAIELAPVANVWVSPEPNSDSTATLVGLALTWEAASPLVAPAWSGLVQKIEVAPGSVLKSGDPVVVIDGVTRIAFHSNVPFSQRLRLGSKGPEVVQLRQFLQSRGLASSASSTYDKALAALVARYAVEIGAQATATAAEFDPGWIVFLPVDQIIVDSLKFTLAAPASAPGEQIVTAAPELTTATLVQQDAIDRILQSENKAKISSDDVLTATGIQSVNVGDAKLKLSAKRNSIAVESLPALRDQVTQNAPGLRASLETPSDPTAFLVPSSAVYTSEKGDLCLNSRTSGGHIGSQKVTVLTQQNGQAVVKALLGLKSQVQVSPPSGDQTCN